MRLSRFVAALVLAPLSPVHAAEPPHPEREVDDEIVITGSPIQKSPDELAIPVNSLDRDHIVSHLGTTLGESLDGEVGINTSGFAPGASRPIIRGQDSFRVRVLENGLGTADVSAIPPGNFPETSWDYTNPAEAFVLREERNHTWVQITLTEGKNRQIHRMGDAIGHRVMRLSRQSFAGISIDRLKPGDYRELKRDELQQLKKKFLNPYRRAREAAKGA